MRNGIKSYIYSDPIDIVVDTHTTFTHPSHFTHTHMHAFNRRAPIGSKMVFKEATTSIYKYQADKHTNEQLN